MQTLEALKRKIKSAEDLLSVVRTMKALAAVSIRHYERAVEALAGYNRTIEMGLHIALHAQKDLIVLTDPALGERVGIVLFGSDQGLCGQFNERVVTHAVDWLNGRHFRRDMRSFAVVGERSAALLSEADQPVDAVFSVPSSVAGITPLVGDLLLKIDSWQSKEVIDRVWLFFNQPAGKTLYRAYARQLLPLDLAWLQELQRTRWPSRVLPTFTMEPRALFAALIRQHLFVSLYRACAESLTSEDASRLASMQNAERNITDRLVELNAHYHHQRQNIITAELQDIIAGFEAVMVRPK